MLINWQVLGPADLAVLRREFMEAFQGQADQTATLIKGIGDKVSVLTRHHNKLCDALGHPKTTEAPREPELPKGRPLTP